MQIAEKACIAERTYQEYEYGKRKPGVEVAIRIAEALGVVEFEVSKNGSYDLGTIALEGYDINGDGWVNAKDFAIYYHEKREELGENYWQFGNEFLIYQKGH